MYFVEIVCSLISDSEARPQSTQPIFDAVCIYATPTTEQTIGYSPPASWLWRATITFRRYCSIWSGALHLLALSSTKISCSFFAGQYSDINFGCAHRHCLGNWQLFNHTLSVYYTSIRLNLCTKSSHKVWFFKGPTWTNLPLLNKGWSMNKAR